ncbi:protein lifeguard 1-like [Hemicordylus capensis]|uniref:protein lifeguard 1-like n=1 Tax=Hemicordylus capensis TaxID=884348 RepID=UPI002302DBBC|nr:protein lifeguard 1-like [Hemicordylus capensis]
MLSHEESFLVFQPLVHEQPGSPQGPNEEGQPRVPEDRSLRKAFLSKVILVLVTQWAVTLAFVLICTLVKHTKKLLLAHIWLAGVPVVGFLFSALSLLCCGDSFRCKRPWRFVVLAILTMGFSWWLGMKSVFYKKEFAFIPLGITAVICLFAVIFSIKIKCDFTSHIVVLLVWVSILSLIQSFTWPLKVLILKIGLALLDALIFTWFLVVETQLLLGNKLVAFSHEEYVLAALLLYMDTYLLYTAIRRISVQERYVRECPRKIWPQAPGDNRETMAAASGTMAAAAAAE